MSDFECLHTVNSVKNLCTIVVVIYKLKERLRLFESLKELSLIFAPGASRRPYVSIIH